MNVAEATLRQLIEAEAKERGLTLVELAHQGKISWSQFHTVINTGITEGTRFSTIQKFAHLLDKRPSELIRIIAE